ncbi:MAG TPA: hypothetical protein VD926_07425, partial [Acidimicrobiales bacterium]|nr:hypothetical protein [Acidimicrobiales bacterium]
TPAPAPTPPASAAPAPPAGAPLARRTPRASLQDAPEDAGAPTATTTSPRTASTRRSPEEVRAMLSRYRRGLEDGRHAPATED